jgi:hypothetical protein
MEIKVSIGEIVDKLSILHIKKEKITDKVKSENILKEYLYLHEIVFAELNIDYSVFDKLLNINEELWNIEDEIREKELAKEFDYRFIELARLVYITNDSRAEFKKYINSLYNSEFVEEKSYSDYKLSKIENMYNELLQIPSDINEHLPTLREYSEKCKHITEMGVRTPTSTWAFLASTPDKLISYDIVNAPGIDEIKSITKESNLDFEFIVDDVLNVEIEQTDLLFIDTLHTYNQLNQELILHSHKVNKYIILHDTVTYGFTDEQIYDHASDYIKSTDKSKSGLRYAISEFLNLNSDWVIEREYLNNNGLIILMKIS